MTVRSYIRRPYSILSHSQKQHRKHRDSINISSFSESMGIIWTILTNKVSATVRTSQHIWLRMAGHVTRGTLKNEHVKEVEEAKEKFLAMSLNDKRKLYKCKDKFKTLDDIETWPQYFEEHIKDSNTYSKWWARNKAKLKSDIRSDLNAKISIFTGDITSLEIDAIANAANESLLGGGGVDGAIHAASGSRLRSECELLNGCSGGDAKITCGYKLPAKYILHTVGPRGEKPEKLRSCYKTCMDLIKENNLKSVAFPCISTGIFGYPNVNAAKEALGTIRTWLEENDEYAKNVDRVIMCLFLKKDVEIYNEQMQMFFPIDRTAAKPSSGEEQAVNETHNNSDADTLDADIQTSDDKSKAKAETPQNVKSESDYESPKQENEADKLESPAKKEKSEDSKILKKSNEDEKENSEGKKDEPS